MAYVVRFTCVRTGALSTKSIALDQHHSASAGASTHLGRGDTRFPSANPPESSGTIVAAGDKVALLTQCVLSATCWPRFSQAIVGYLLDFRVQRIRRMTCS